MEQTLTKHAGGKFKFAQLSYSVFDNVKEGNRTILCDINGLKNQAIKWQI